MIEVLPCKVCGEHPDCHLIIYKTSVMSIYYECPKCKQKTERNKERCNGQYKALLEWNKLNKKRADSAGTLTAQEK